MPSGKETAAAPPADLPNGEMVQRFDSYLYRQRAALPAPAQAEIDAISADRFRRSSRRWSASTPSTPMRRTRGG